MSIETRHRADGDAYYVVRFRVNGKSRSKTFARRTDARRFDAGTQHSLNNGTYIPPRLGKMTLEAFANDWMNQQSCSGSTRAKYRSLLDARIVPGLGSLTLDEVTPARINTFLHDLATELAPSTVTTIASLLSSLALSAVDNERIKRTFMPRRLSLPRAQADRRVFLTSGQVDRLVDAAEARDKALIFTAAWTGLRWGELAGLRTERVDLDKRTIEVREALVDVSGHLSPKRRKQPTAGAPWRLRQKTSAFSGTTWRRIPPATLGTWCSGRPTEARSATTPGVDGRGSPSSNQSPTSQTQRGSTTCVTVTSRCATAQG